MAESGVFLHGQKKKKLLFVTIYSIWKNVHVYCQNIVFFNIASVVGDISWSSVFKQLSGVRCPLDTEADRTHFRHVGTATFYKARIDFMYCI